MNKTQKEVYNLSVSIKDLTPKMQEWINTTSDRDWLHYHKGNGTFLEYFVVYQRVKNWQVIRYFAVRRKRAFKWQKETFECLRYWIDADGRQVTECRRRFWGNYILDNWDTNTDLEIRNFCGAYYNDILKLQYTYIKVRSLIPELKRMGFATPTTPEPCYFTADILKDGRLEMLYRMGLKNLIWKAYQSLHFDMYPYQWTAIRIALRHHYDLKSKEVVDKWWRVVQWLHDLNMDVHNPHFVAPDNLQELYDRLQRRMDVHRERQAVISRDERERKEYEESGTEQEKQYKEDKKNYLPIAFSNSKFNAHVLQSVKEFLDEGLAMNHCVFACGYYSKENSVILSITDKENHRLETCEVDVKKNMILQLYGKNDKFTEWHDEIKEFINNNLWRFKQVKEVAL